MKIPFSWLKHFLDTKADINEVSLKLTSIGLEVEEIIDRSVELKDFIIAEIIDAKPHPDATSLQICTVNNGTEDLQIVCGAKNARKGLKVVLAPLGAKIPSNGMAIKEVKIRGIESSGMLCSERELLVGDDDNGIIEVPNEFKVGDSFLSLYGLDDAVIDISITPNRGDCFGIYGIARDLAASGIGELKKIEISNIDHTIQNDFKVSIKEKDLCPSFCLYEIRNIENKPSPLWLKNFLKNSGISSISYPVDITNFISHCFGKPLHVYDKDSLSGELIVEKAQNGLKFKALNDKEYILSDSDLVVSSGSKVCALAGVIGGVDSSCRMDTKNIIIESAMFDPIIISKMGRNHSITTDSRQRFERSIDSNFIEEAAIMAVSMIQEYCGGKIGKIYSTKADIVIKNISLKYETVNKISGFFISKEIIEEILLKLGFTILSQDINNLLVKVPSWRNDISIEEDLVEEILRIYGFNNIKEIPITKEFRPRILSFQQKTSSTFKRIMTTRDYDEVITWSFGNSAEIEHFAELNPNLYIANPISSELNYLRPTILPNLINLVEKALNKNHDSHGFFEVGPIFQGLEPNQELLSISGIKYGKVNLPPNFDLRNIDIYDIKSDVVLLLKNAGLSFDSLILDSTDLPKYYHPRRSSALKLGKNIIGYFGEIHPSILLSYKIKVPVCGFEILISKLPESRLKYGWSNDIVESHFQASKRDFAFIIDKFTQASSLVSFIKNIDKQLIESVEIFDVYEGNKVGLDKKSVAYKVTIRSKERTLSDEEINILSQDIVNKVMDRFAAILRS